MALFEDIALVLIFGLLFYFIRSVRGKLDWFEGELDTIRGSAREVGHRLEDRVVRAAEHIMRNEGPTPQLPEPPTQQTSAQEQQSEPQHLFIKLPEKED